MDRSSQRGASTVVVTLLLLGATLLGLLAANRQLLLELRLSGNQVRSAEAFEAAEAGLDWATALLNSPQPLGDDCRAGGTQDFRARHLAIDALARITPAAATPRCVHDGTAWQCRCDAAGAPPAPASAPSFTLHLTDGGRPGVLRLRADGAGPPDAVARTEVLLALQPALASPPATALTLKDPAQGVDAFFARHFGMARSSWLAQPVVQRLACSGDCGAALAAAGARQQLFGIEGDLLLRGPLTLGNTQRPLLLTVAGRLRVEGEVSLVGLVHAAAVDWVGPTGPWRGALLVEGPAGGSGSFDLFHDPDALAALRMRQGSFVRVPGSWRDF